MRLSSQFVLPGAMALKALVLTLALIAVARAQREPILCAWDCVYYKDIAEKGYSFTPGKQGNMAFFPIYPTLVGVVSRTLGAPFEKTGIAFNLLLFPVLLWLFARWAKAVGLANPWLAPLLLVVDRHTFWTHIPYTETLFTSTLLVFLLLQRDPEAGPAKRFLVPLLAGFASGTRLVGVALVGGLGLGHFGKYLRRPHWGILTLIVGLWGVLGYFLYLQLAHGSWKLSIITTSFWNRYHSLPGLMESFRILFARMYFPTVLVLVGSLWMLLKPPKELKLTPTERFTFALLIYIPMANSVQLGLTRYLSIILPGYVGIAWLLDKAARSDRFRAAPRWARAAAWAGLAAVAIGEIYWQVVLTKKFFLNEAFFWAA